MEDAREETDGTPDKTVEQSKKVIVGVVIECEPLTAGFPGRKLFRMHAFAGDATVIEAIEWAERTARKEGGEIGDVKLYRETD